MNKRVAIPIYWERMKKFGCELFGNDCDGLSGNCDCGVIKEKK